MIDIETEEGIEVRTHEVVTWANMAEAVARADSRAQAEFFEHLAICLDGVTMGPGRWEMQCRAIAEERSWLPLNRTRIAGQLEVLAEHMREDVEPVRVTTDLCDTVGTSEPLRHFHSKAK